jgi:NTE family protein
MLDVSSLNWLEQLRDRFIGQPDGGAAPEPPAPRTLGLALGGGGGKGAAHVGVLQVFEELQLPLDLIAGSSAGGAVAVFYAAGLSFDEIRELFRTMALWRIAVPDPTRTGLIGQKRREEILARALGDRTFADLPVPCAVTAVDLVSGQVVVINEGSLVEAVLATTAVPGILPPVFRDDMVLADGGILNNLPVDVARGMGAQRVIAVELNDAVPGFSLIPALPDNPLARLTLAPQQFNVAIRALSLLVNHTTALQLRENPPDLLLSPSVADIPTLDMSNPEKGEEVGLATARDFAEELLALRSWRLDEPRPAPEPPSAPEQAWRLNLPFALPRWGEPPSSSPEKAA